VRRGARPGSSWTIYALRCCQGLVMKLPVPAAPRWWAPGPIPPVRNREVHQIEVACESVVVPGVVHQAA
jgi:hypothetical protein